MHVHITLHLRDHFTNLVLLRSYFKLYCSFITFSAMYQFLQVYGV